MTTTDTEDRIRRRDDEEADIYDEDGNVRGDFLALLGAAIADRDTLFLRQNVARLPEYEIGDLLESIQP
ncbi:magnesium transporter, partial [Rhizobium phaseoli]